MSDTVDQSGSIEAEAAGNAGDLLMIETTTSTTTDDGQQQVAPGWEAQLVTLIQAIQHFTREQLINLIVRLIASTPTEAELLSKSGGDVLSKRRRTSSDAQHEHLEEEQQLMDVDGTNSVVRGELPPLVNSATTCRYYNWAKYGNKYISPKSILKQGGGAPEKLRKEYFKCTSPGCQAKRTILHAPDTKTEEYEGFHNHIPPTRARATKELRDQLIERIQNGESPAELFKTIDAENIGLSKRALYNLKYTQRGEKKAKRSTSDESGVIQEGDAGVEVDPNVVAQPQEGFEEPQEVL